MCRKLGGGELKGCDIPAHWPLVLLGGLRVGVVVAVETVE